MFKLRIGSVSVSFSFSFFCVAAIMLLTCQRELVLLCLFSSAFHEAGHLLFMVLFKAKIVSVTFGGFGIRIEREESLISFYAEAVISLGGIIFNSVLIFVFAVLYAVLGKEIFFAAVVINCALALFNGLPVRMLDGWNFLRYILLAKKGEEKAEAITEKISFVFVCVFVLLAVIYTAFCGMNISLLAVIVYLCFIFCAGRK